MKHLCLALLGLTACDDKAERTTDAGLDVADTSADVALGDAVDDDAVADDGAGLDATVAPDVAEVADSSAADTVYPDIVYADALLPLAPGYDESYVGKGDAVVSTLVEVLRPRHGLVAHVDEAGRLLAPADELGWLDAQPGEPHRLRDQLAAGPDGPVDWTPGALPAGSRSILYALVLADPQLVDQDSPAQVAKNASRTLAGISLPAYTPQGELGVHANDALVRTADRFQDERPFDVVIVAGDHIENSQRNELRQLHTIFNGGLVSSDSGAADDPTQGPDNDAFDPFVAGGFRAGTPWISTIGNHDVNIEGNFPLGLVADINQDESIRAELDALGDPLGVTFPYEPTAAAHPALFPHAMRSAFRVDPSDFNPAMMTSDAELQTLVPGPTPADPERAPMGVCGFIHQTFAAAGDPPGHGFTAANDEDCTGFYVYEPVPGVPLRILSLDLGPHEGGSNGILAPPYKEGAVDAAHAGDPTADQVAFVEAELARAEADGFGVIVISHQPSDAVVTQSQLQDLAGLLDGFPDLRALIDKWSPIPPESVTSTAFRKLLAGSPSVIAHIAGHNHRNRVRAICPDGSARADGEARCAPGEHGETGYWELTTAAGIDFPHQGRFVEVVHVGGRQAALYLTMLDPRIPAGSFSERARFVSCLHEELGAHGFGGLGDLGDRNLLLPFTLSEAVAANWQDVGTTKLESETSLTKTLPALPRLPVWPTP
ncbi:MAG: metallophosphoesterase [Myxococcota bacterium]